MSGVETSLTTTAPNNDLPHLRYQCELLSRWAFTDFEQAKKGQDYVCPLPPGIVPK